MLGRAIVVLIGEAPSAWSQPKVRVPLLACAAVLSAYDQRKPKFMR